MGPNPAARVHRTEKLNLDYLAVQDHPYQPGQLDAWTLISHLSALTERISFLTDVADMQLRPPVMLAKAAMSLSALTNGRIQLGLGGGGIPDAVASMGGPARRGQDMVAFAEESLGLMRTALAGGVVRLHSRYHSICTASEAAGLTVQRLRLEVSAANARPLLSLGPGLHIRAQSDRRRRPAEGLRQSHRSRTSRNRRRYGSRRL